MTTPMDIPDLVRTVATALALPALHLCPFTDDQDEVWEPFLDEVYS